LAGVGTRFVIEVERGKETAQLGRVLHLLAVLGCDLTIGLPGTGAGAGSGSGVRP
jgi:hypothetical protein